MERYDLCFKRYAHVKRVMSSMKITNQRAPDVLWTGAGPQISV